MEKASKKQNSSTPSSAALIQTSSSEANLSKGQQAFNRLIDRIEKLRKRIDADTTRMDEIARYFNRELRPKAEEMAKLKIRLAYVLDSKMETGKLSKVVRKALPWTIRALLEDACRVVELDEPAVALYEKYTDQPAKADRGEMESSPEIMAALFKDRFGVEIDPSLLTGDFDEARIQDEVQRQLDEKCQQEKPRKRSKKELEREEMERQKAEMKDKSLRSLYVSLAKLLHPDAEPDPRRKQEKDELMKQVTAAYQERNILKLLELEMRWAKERTNKLNEMDGQALAVYVHILKDQVADLEFENFQLLRSPAYIHISSYMHLNAPKAKADIDKHVMFFDRTNDDLEESIANLETGKNENVAIKRCIMRYQFEDYDMY